jgi:hypothetical protein
MTDGQAVGFGQAGGGASGNGAQQQTPVEATPSEFVTRQEFETLIDKRIQSLKDKRLSDVDRQVKEKLEQLEQRFMELKEAGLNPAPAALDAAKAEIVRQALTSQQQAQAQAQQQGGQAAQDAMEAAVQEIYEEYGVTLLTNDPEAQEISAKMQAGQLTPRGFLKAIEAATKAKAAREQQAKGNQAAARMPGLGGGGAATAGLEAQYRAEVTEAQKRGGGEAVLQVRRKYRAKGLNV